MKNTDFSCQSTLDTKYIDNLYNDAFVCVDRFKPLLWLVLEWKDWYMTKTLTHSIFMTILENMYLLSFYWDNGCHWIPCKFWLMITSQVLLSPKVILLKCCKISKLNITSFWKSNVLLRLGSLDLKWHVQESRDLYYFLDHTMSR